MSMKIGTPVFRAMAEDEPDFISSDCQLSAHHIAQGMAEANLKKATLLHPLSLHGACLRSRRSGACSHETDAPGPAVARGIRPAARSRSRHGLNLHKKSRTVHLGEHMTLLFEDRETVTRTRSRRCCASRRPSVPARHSGRTRCLQSADPRGRQLQGHHAAGILECRATARPGTPGRMSNTASSWKQKAWRAFYAIADEDLRTQHALRKTSAVHFLRFQVSPAHEDGAGRRRTAQARLRSHRVSAAHRRRCLTRCWQACCKDLSF